MNNDCDHGDLDDDHDNEDDGGGVSDGTHGCVVLLKFITCITATTTTNMNQ